MEDLLQFLLSAEGSKYIIYGIIALALLSTSLMVLSGWYRYTKANAPWARLAHRTGLTLIPGHLIFPQRYPVVEGTYKGYPLKLTWWSRYREGGNSDFTVITIPVNQGDNFHFSPTNIFSKLGQIVGWHEVKIGDDSFDRKIDIRCSPEDLASQLLDDQEIRHRILKLSRWYELKLERQTLTLRFNGVVRDNDRLIQAFDLTSDLARRLDQLPS
ncbi:MAG: hypothetical protein WAM60_15025 [Candidatus Promineifilaceae bacterium]